jgi:hypothetical protein
MADAGMTLPKNSRNARHMALIWRIMSGGEEHGCT